MSGWPNRPALWSQGQLSSTSTPYQSPGGCQITCGHPPAEPTGRRSRWPRLRLVDLPRPLNGWTASSRTGRYTMETISCKSVMEIQRHLKLSAGMLSNQEIDIEASTSSMPLDRRMMKIVGQLLVRMTRSAHCLMRWRTSRKIWTQKLMGCPTMLRNLMLTAFPRQLGPTGVWVSHWMICLQSNWPHSWKLNECRRSTRSMGRSLKESKRKICSVLMMSCMVKKMGGGVCRRGTCLHHAGEIKVVHKENWPKAAENQRRGQRRGNKASKADPAVKPQYPFGPCPTQPGLERETALENKVNKLVKGLELHKCDCLNEPGHWEAVRELIKE